jgi:hypothetical protein
MRAHRVWPTELEVRLLGLVLGFACVACRHESAPHATAALRDGVSALHGADSSHGAASPHAVSSPSAAPPRTSAEEAEIKAALAALRQRETELRAHTDFRTLAPSSRAFGPNPYALVAVPGTTRFAGILRGDSRVVLLDTALVETSSLPTSASPSALAAAPGGHVFVAGPLAPKIERFRVTGAALEANGAFALPSGVVPRALAADDRELVVADFVGDRLFTLPIAPARAVPAARSVPPATATCQGPFRLALSARHLAVACLFDHRVVVYARGPGQLEREVARITHDGPLWSLALLEHGDELFIAAGGVEDHPLERRDRVFGYIDSFAYLYVLEPDGTLVRRRAENTSALGVVVPKAVALRERAGNVELLALGYATAQLLALTPDGAARTSAALPGCSDLVLGGERILCSNPLFDAWVELGTTEPVLHPVRSSAASEPPASVRLGEALFFTTLMAPDAQSDGRLSRFTCETCHFEGATDGRVHNSGRHAFDSADDVRVSTRPLFGLFNDAPHFSRAHDPDLTSVCNNEFTVANRGNPVDPWFSLAPERFAWLRELAGSGAELSPPALRRALFDFFARFSHEENPFVAAHEPARHFNASERKGAESFRERCAGCHEPRLVASDESTRVPFERWEELIFSAETPIVWARGDYAKTGILPYVDREGTRIPSLRRLYLKRPYFTNGGAHSLAAVLEGARFSERDFFHAETLTADADLRSLGAATQRSLLDFLRLL